VQATRDGAVGRIATLILPADTAWGAAAAAPRCRGPGRGAAFDAVRRRATRTLHAAGAACGAAAGRRRQRSERAQHLAAAIAAKHRLPVMAEFYNARMPGGRGRPRIERLPYVVDAAVAKLAGAELLVLAGAVEPIGFFAYPGKPSQLEAAGCRAADAGHAARRRARRAAGAGRRAGRQRRGHAAGAGRAAARAGRAR
jgi:acetolactate synthase-1/2/3 large subunit